METLLAAISDGTKWSFRKLEKLVFALCWGYKDLDQTQIIINTDGAG
jgi:hypothetical protein